MAKSIKGKYFPASSISYSNKNLLLQLDANDITKLHFFHHKQNVYID